MGADRVARARGGVHAKAALPLFAIMVLAVGVLAAFPDIATFQPNAMSARPG